MQLTCCNRTGVLFTFKERRIMKIYKYLYKMAYKLRQKGLYYELKSHIKDDNYLKLLNRHDRGIGKTYTLMQLSKKYNMPVLEPNESLKSMFKREFPKAIIISPNDIMSRGIKYDTTLLVDEKQMLAKDCNKYIDDHFKQVGFIANPY